MSTLAIVLIVIGVVVLLLLLGGFAAARKRPVGDYARHVAEADNALEQARAADRGWDREVLEEAARTALAERQPGHHYEGLHLVLVDDQPGVTEDRAHFAAVGADGEVRIVLVRGTDGWAAERVE